MRSDKNSGYIIDPLYGLIYLPDYVKDILNSPELQRLREVRLCNINSLCLTGGANINRYEHAIGTCYLALECLHSWPPLDPMSNKDQDCFILAALLHDITSAAFGHSVEYIESKDGFSHESAFNYVVGIEHSDSYQYKSFTLEPIYFGMRGMLSSKISEDDLKKINEIILGKGKFGPLIRSKMDLDNIDNVFRLAYHIGLVRNGEIPLELARSLYTYKDELVVKEESLALIEEWHKLRKKLYSILLLNIEEFSAKAMLTEAIEIAKLYDNKSFNWSYVDYQFLEKLSEVPAVRIPVKKPFLILDEKFEKELNNLVLSDELKNNLKMDIKSDIQNDNDGWIITDGKNKCFIKIIDKNIIAYKEHFIGYELHNIISRLMIGDLYGCIGIFSTKKTNKYDLFTNIEKKMELEDRLNQIVRSKLGQINKFKSSMILVHPILDVDKTQRKISIHTDKGRFITIGNSSNQLLIGVFFKNTKLNIYEMNKLDEKTAKKLRQEIFIYLSDTLDDKDLAEMEPCGEIDY